MSDYAQVTSFGPKDALITGNPAKLVKGVEYDVEFAAIAAAILSKFDSGDVADNTTALAGVSDATLITPLKLRTVLDAETAPFPTVTFKASSTSRSSTATPTNDPDLITDTLQPGTYLVQVWGNFNTSGGNQGAFVRFGGSATIRATNPGDATAMYSLMGSNNPSASTPAPGALPIAAANYPTVGYSIPSSHVNNAFMITARVTITVAGTLALQWSQSVSDSGATILSGGATMIVTQVA